MILTTALISLGIALAALLIIGFALKEMQKALDVLKDVLERKFD